MVVAVVVNGDSALGRVAGEVEGEWRWQKRLLIVGRRNAEGEANQCVKKRCSKTQKMALTQRVKLRGAVWRNERQ